MIVLTYALDLVRIWRVHNEIELSTVILQYLVLQHDNGHRSIILIETSILLPVL